MPQCDGRVVGSHSRSPGLWEALLHGLRRQWCLPGGLLPSRTMSSSFPFMPVLSTLLWTCHYWVSCWLGASAPTCKVLTGRNHLCEIHLSKHQMQLTEASWPCLGLPSHSPHSCLVLLKTERRGGRKQQGLGHLALLVFPSYIHSHPLGEGGGLGAPQGHFARSPAAAPSSLGCSLP